MLIGVPAEVKDRESRVAVTPGGARELIERGHTVLVQAGAGKGSSFADGEYAAVGATLAPDAPAVFGAAEMIVKVKEPTAAEFPLLRPEQLLFTYLHLAAEPDLTRLLIERRVEAVAYETVREASGALPLLTPMSEVAGRMSVQIGAHYLEATNGGGGILLGGVPGVLPASVVIIGGGVVGTNAAEMAIGLGASVTIVDRALDRLRYLDQVLNGRVTTLASNTQNVAAAVRDADLLIGAVLIPGARAPRIVSEPMISTMRPGSVVVDVAIDQGGCIATSHPTSHSDPTYYVDGVLHYCVTNMPGAVPRTSTLALSNATLPYVVALADHGLVQAAERDPSLAQGVNVLGGKVTNEAVAKSLGYTYVPLTDMLRNHVAIRPS